MNPAFTKKQVSVVMAKCVAPIWQATLVFFAAAELVLKKGGYKAGRFACNPWPYVVYALKEQQAAIADRCNKHTIYLHNQGHKIYVNYFQNLMQNLPEKP